MLKGGITGTGIRRLRWKDGSGKECFFLEMMGLNVKLEGIGGKGNENYGDIGIWEERLY